MEKIILWNPSLRKSVSLPEPRVIFKSHGSYQSSVGFGFVPETNDYKILRVVYLQLPDSDKVPPEVEIYELSTGRWRNVNAGDFSYVISERASQAFLKGSVHWDAHNPNEVGGTFERLIVSFDMTNEKFGALMVPNSLQNQWCLSVSTFRESLCLIHHKADFMLHHGDNFCCIWVMKEYGIADSWAKLCTIGQGENCLCRPVYFRENGDILLAKHSGNSSDDKANLVSYDPKTNQFMNLGVREKARSFYVDTYTESLVLIKGSNEVLGSLSHPPCLNKDDEVKGTKKVTIKGEFQEYERVVAKMENQAGEGSKLEEQHEE